jgi:DHA2 family multidrug resistance protein
MRGSMLAQVASGDPEAVGRLAGIKAMLMAKGYDAVSADGTALRMLDGLIRRQAMVLSFEKLFYLAGILFLFIIPLIFVLRRPKTLPGAKPIEVHVEM